MENVTEIYRLAFQAAREYRTIKESNPVAMVSANFE